MHFSCAAQLILLSYLWSWIAALLFIPFLKPIRFSFLIILIFFDSLHSIFYAFNFIGLVGRFIILQLMIIFKYFVMIYSIKYLNFASFKEWFWVGCYLSLKFLSIWPFFSTITLKYHIASLFLSSFWTIFELYPSLVYSYLTLDFIWLVYFNVFTSQVKPIFYYLLIRFSHLDSQIFFKLFNLGFIYYYD